MESESHEWQVLTDYPNYEINTKTQMIRNIKTKRILSIYTSKNGYQFVQIGGRNQCYHRVIASQFVPNPDPKKYNEVNHKNHIRNDNRPVNLEWVTPSANQRDRLPFTQQKKMVVKELLEGCSPIAQYKGYTFDDYYYNPSTEEILKRTKKGFQVICLNHLYKTFYLTDANDVKH